MTAMEMIFHTSPKAGITWERFCELFGSCEFEDITDNGDVIGAVMYRGNEVHLGTIRSPKGFGARRILRHILRKMITVHGEIKALVPPRCAEYAEKLKRFGFVEQSRDGERILLILKEMPSWVSKQ